MAKSATREPLMRIAKREPMPFWQAVLVRIAGIVLALIVSALFIMLVTKLNPIAVYKSMALGAFGTPDRAWATARKMALLLCLGIGIAPAFMMRFWNVGAEGQMLVGALSAVTCMITFADLPQWLLLTVMVITSCIAGALWALLPALFKAKWGTNETLFTLMMNYIALFIVEFMVDVWDKKHSHTLGVVNMMGKNQYKGWFSKNDTTATIVMLVIVLALMVAMYFYLKRSKQGYEIAVVGESFNTARYAGINVGRTIIRTMLISGAICGLAGFLEASAISHTVSNKTAGGRGFTAIIIAWLAKFNTFTMLLIAMLIAFLDKGATQIASDFQLNEFAAQVITGIILFFILACEFFVQYRVVFRGHKEVRA